MARVRTLCTVALLVAMLAPAPVSASLDAGATGRAGDLGLPDGAAWARARVDVADAPCVRFVLEGVVAHAGDGQAVLVDVPRVGRLGLYFGGDDGVVVRASANVSVVRTQMGERVGAVGHESAFATTFRACHPWDGVAYSGVLDAWALHTSGVRDAVTRLEASAGSLTVTPVSEGSAVSLWGLASFEKGVTAAAATGSLAGVVRAGASVAVDVEKRATSAGPVFGALAHFDLVEEYELHGPAGAHAWKHVTGSGGSVDPGAFHGQAGEWVAKIRVSAGSASSPRAFFVLADLSA